MSYCNHCESYRVSRRSLTLALVNAAPIITGALGFFTAHYYHIRKNEIDARLRIGCVGGRGQ
jgi:hypothetical protein